MLTAAEMRDWDRRAIEEHSIPERVLMEVAGRAAARVVQRLYPDGTVVAAIGGGNNGGDAVVMLRALRAWGREVVAVPLAEGGLPGALLHGRELPVASAAEARSIFPSAGVLVDGLLGTGARGAPRESAAELIDAINSAGRPVVALDGPSGVDMTGGQTPGVAVRADLTVTFGAPKRGLLRFPGRSCAGRIIAVEIGFPPLAAGKAGAAVITPEWARARLPSVPPNAHKGTLGTVAVVAGQAGMAGAAVMVGMGAARTGAGLIRLISPAGNRTILQTALPEALFADRNGEKWGDSLRGADAVVAGPGMGTDDAALDALRTVLSNGNAPLLLDADALNLLARVPDLLDAGRGRSLLLTPHPGEMSRLMAAKIKDVIADPFRFAAEASRRFGCAVLLKGAPSVVAVSGEAVRVNVTGHSGIATAGMGDTLAGIAAALLAQGCSPGDAGALALYYSGRAAEIAGRGRSLLPRDIVKALPLALAETPARLDLDMPEIIFDLPPPQ